MIIIRVHYFDSWNPKVKTIIWNVLPFQITMWDEVSVSKSPSCITHSTMIDSIKFKDFCVSTLVYALQLVMFAIIVLIHKLNFVDSRYPNIT